MPELVVISCLGLAILAAILVDGGQVPSKREEFIWGVSLFSGFWGLATLMWIWKPNPESFWLDLVIVLIALVGALALTYCVRFIAHEVRFVRHDIRRR
jgi:hypothetical protein